MSWINDRIDSRLRAVRTDVCVRPAIDAAKAACARPGATSDSVLAAALSASRDTFVRAGQAPHPDLVRERALLAAAAAVAERPTSLADLPAGDDKTRHFFVSGWLSLQCARAADVLLPRGLAARLGEFASVGLGFLKELHDMAFATGFSREDLAADVAGARAGVRT